MKKSDRDYHLNAEQKKLAICRERMSVLKLSLDKIHQEIKTLTTEINRAEGTIQNLASIIPDPEKK